MRISQITRQDIVDAITVEEINWSGRMEESEFLSRLFNLGSLPSFDHRFKDAAGDIWQHRVNNSDWDSNWVFYDSRFSLMNGDDDSFLAFLCETIHPVVRPDPAEAERICQLYNQYLRNDGYQTSKQPIGKSGVPCSGLMPIAPTRTILLKNDGAMVAISGAAHPPSEPAPYHLSAGGRWIRTVGSATAAIAVLAA